MEESRGRRSEEGEKKAGEWKEIRKTRNTPGAESQGGMTEGGIHEVSLVPWQYISHRNNDYC